MGGRLRWGSEKAAACQHVVRGVPYREETRDGRTGGLMGKVTARRVQDEVVRAVRSSLYARHLRPNQFDEEAQHQSHNQEQVTHDKQPMHARTYAPRPWRGENAGCR